MNRGARMLLQLFAPALVVAAGGMAAGALLLQTGVASADLASATDEYARIARWLQFGSAGAGVMMTMYSLWRLWRWERGMEPQCPCGGLLSRPVSGRGGRARRCLGCRRPHPEN
ncbi:hypothetical protein [Lysobacter sp. TAB13]|uniref:hypothetical protein n=1 Tax=Lysobacter sp. TAB13 TaxID=3233065 RepID=UPI003F99664C